MGKVGFDLPAALEERGKLSGGISFLVQQCGHQIDLTDAFARLFDFDSDDAQRQRVGQCIKLLLRHPARLGAFGPGDDLVAGAARKHLAALVDPSQDVNASLFEECNVRVSVVIAVCDDDIVGFEAVPYLVPEAALAGTIRPDGKIRQRTRRQAEQPDYACQGKAAAGFLPAGLAEVCLVCRSVGH